MLSAHALEQALFDHLASRSDLVTKLGGKHIYAEPNRNAAFPYITLAIGPTRDWSTGTEQGESHRVILHIWGNSDAQEAIRTIQNDVMTALHDITLSLTRHNLINLTFELADLRPDRKNRLLQGILQYRAVTEPKA